MVCLAVSEAIAPLRKQDAVGTGKAADHHGRQPPTLCPNARASEAELGTKWEQDWQYQPNAATMYVRQGSIVTALQSKPLSITATCFQYHEYGRRTGLKIR